MRIRLQSLRHPYDYVAETQATLASSVWIRWGATRNSFYSSCLVGQSFAHTISQCEATIAKDLNFNLRTKHTFRLLL